jgi:hypothetical protein
VDFSAGASTGAARASRAENRRADQKRYEPVSVIRSLVRSSTSVGMDLFPVWYS